MICRGIRRVTFRALDGSTLRITHGTELGEVRGHEHDQHQTGRQLLIPSPLQTKDRFQPENTPHRVSL